MQKKHEASAFPTDIAQDDGMTLRDYFAAKALVGICHFWVQTRTKTTINDPAPDIVAKMSYEFADAMLKAREGK